MFLLRHVINFITIDNTIKWNNSLRLNGFSLNERDGGIHNVHNLYIVCFFDKKKMQNNIIDSEFGARSGKNFIQYKL